MKRNREEKAVIAKRRKGPGKIFLPIILAMIFCCSLTAFANQNITLSERVNEINVREKGSIEIELTDGGENISKEDVVFRYAKVADIKDGQYVLKEQYKNCGVDLNQISYAKELDEAAEKLSYYGESDGDCITNEEGIAKIEDLDVGVYLLYVSEQKNYEKRIAKKKDEKENSGPRKEKTKAKKGTRAAKQKEANYQKTVTDEKIRKEKRRKAGAEKKIKCSKKYRV